MGLDSNALLTALAKLDACLSQPASLCFIGSSATTLSGQESRQTEGIDVWRPASSVRWNSLQAACEAAGVAFAPKDKFPEEPCLQVMHPGIVQLPGWDATKREWFGKPGQVVWQGERLTVLVPPARAIAASKLVQGNARDLGDCLWLMAAQGMDAEAIREAVEALPRGARRKAEDNLATLNLISPRRSGSVSPTTARSPAPCSQPQG